MELKVGEKYLYCDTEYELVALDGDVAWIKAVGVLRHRDGSPYRATVPQEFLRGLPPTEVGRRVVADSVCLFFDGHPAPVTFRADLDGLKPYGHLIKWSDGTVTYEAVQS